MAPRKPFLDAWKWRLSEARACAPLLGFNPEKKPSLRTRLLSGLKLEKSGVAAAEHSAGCARGLLRQVAAQLTNNDLEHS